MEIISLILTSFVFYILYQRGNYKLIKAFISTSVLLILSIMFSLSFNYFILLLTFIIIDIILIKIFIIELLFHSSKDGNPLIPINITKDNFSTFISFLPSLLLLAQSIFYIIKSSENNFTLLNIQLLFLSLLLLIQVIISNLNKSFIYQHGIKTSDDTFIGWQDINYITCKESDIKITYKLFLLRKDLPIILEIPNNYNLKFKTLIKKYGLSAQNI